jgi:hypothetical protein
MKNLNQLLKQAQEMQQKMGEMQQKMGETVVEGSSGGGMVKVALSGKGDVHKIKIDPSLLNKEEGEILEDLLVAAFHDAKGKADAQMSEQMQRLTGGMGLPGGMKFPF